MIGIIADDLTGASDSGVQLARKGYDTLVVFHPEKLTSAEAAEVIVVDTDSRALPPEEAYQKVAKATAKLDSLAFSHLFKKLDSTLRGNIGREIDAVMDSYPFDFAIIAPAFPRIGRTTRDGVHFLKGVPVHQTEIARDPKCPVLESHLPTLLSNQSHRSIGYISLTQLREGPNTIISKMEEWKAKGVALVVFDAEEDEDLKKIAEFSKESPYRLLWVGSAGLAEFIPLLHTEEPKRMEENSSVPPSGLPILLVAGSLSSTTRKQVQRFNQVETVSPIEFNPEAVLSEESWSKEKNRCRNKVFEAVKEKKDVSLYVGTSDEQLKLSRDPAFAEKWGAFEVSRRIAESLGEIAAELIQKEPLQGVIMTGGDTAKSVCDYLDVSGIRLLDEVEDGIPVSRLVGKRELFAVTKAGAFGNEESLVHALKVLKGEKVNV